METIPIIPIPDPLNRRRAPRALLCASALVAAAGRPPTEHMTYDVSAGGMRLCGLPDAEVGSEVTVRLQLGRSWIRASGLLLRLGSTEGSSDFAVEFQGLSAGAEDAIHDAVVEALAHPERRSVLLLASAGDPHPPGGEWLAPIWSICATASTPLAALSCLERHAIEVGIVSLTDRDAPTWAWAEVDPKISWRAVGPLGCLHRVKRSQIRSCVD